MKTNRLITLLLILTIFTLMTEMESKVRHYSGAVVERLVANVAVSSDKSLEAKLSDKSAGVHAIFTDLHDSLSEDNPLLNN